MEENVNTIEQQHQHNSNETASNDACGCGSGCGCHSEGQGHAHGQTELPIRFQILRKGDKVVELGSGTGNDVLAAAQMIGAEGKVVGIDLKEGNINTSREYAGQLKMNNVEFQQGPMEDLPLENEFANIVFSNCDFNLSKDKQKVADEMYRVVDHNGLACVTDFVSLHDVPQGLREDGSELVSSIAGAENINTFIGYFQKTGFQHVEVVEMKKVHLPQDIFEKYLSADEVEQYKDVKSEKGLFSVTLIGEKPSTCSADTCCCNPDKHQN